MLRKLLTTGIATGLSLIASSASAQLGAERIEDITVT